MAERVLVLGGGFAGLESAIAARAAGFEVTLVSERDYLYIYPVSIWIPIRETGFDDVCLPLARAAAAHGFRFVRGRVGAIDTAAARVGLEDGRKLGYDYLVIALGAAKMPAPGIEHTLSICGPPEASLALRERIDALVARGRGRIAVGFGGNPKDPSAVRGGPAFEFVFNLHHFLSRKGLRDAFELSLFAPMPKPGIRLGEKAFDMLVAWLGRMGIERRFGLKIKGFHQDGVEFEDSSRLESDLTMFIAAGRGLDLFRESGLPVTEAGFVRIDDHCRVEGCERVFAAGDSAALEGPDWRAKQGHLAEVMARVAVENIAAIAAGGRPAAGYQDKVGILCLMDFGNGAALVKRDQETSVVRPMPVVGHWLKKSWAAYWKLSRRKLCPRLPGA